MDGCLEDDQGDDKRADAGHFREIDGCSTDEKSGSEANDEGPSSGDGCGALRSQSQFSSEVANIAAECQRIALCSGETDEHGDTIKSIHRLTFLRRQAIGLQQQMMTQAGPAQMANTVCKQEIGEGIRRLSGQIAHLSKLIREAQAEARQLTKPLRQARAEPQHESLSNVPNKSTTADGTPARSPTPAVDIRSTSRAGDEEARQLQAALLRSVGVNAERGVIPGKDGAAEEQNSSLDWAALEKALEEAAQTLADVQDNPSPPKRLEETNLANFSQHWGTHPSSSEEDGDKQRTMQEFDLDEDFAHEQLVLTDMALYNYETYHSMSHGTASVGTVDASSAGILGWAACVFDAAKNRSVQQEDQNGDQQPSKRGSGNAKGRGAAKHIFQPQNSATATGPHPPSRADEEEATQLQVALLQSIGVKAKSVGLTRESMHSIAEDEAYDYYYSSDDDGEWSEDSQAGGDYEPNEMGDGGPGSEETDTSSVRRVPHGINMHGNTKEWETKNSSAQFDSSSYSFCSEGSGSLVGGKNSRQSSQTSWQNIASSPVPPRALEPDHVPDKVWAEHESVASSEDWSVLSIDKE